MNVETPAGPPVLELHVLGAGKGESLILKLPTDQWAVIDCYSPSLTNPQDNLTLRFLRSRDVQELELLCLTHPHEDHYRGMTQLLTALKIHRFCLPAVMTGENLRSIVAHEIGEADRSGELSIRENARELRAIIDRVAEMAEGNDLTPASASSGAEILLSPPFPDSLSIRAVAPTGKQIMKYHTGLGKNFDPDQKLKTKNVPMEHNRASIGLVVDYGKTRLVLGGDVEKDCWSEALREPSLADRLKAATFVKVSHHGSKTGYCEELWPHFASGPLRPIAVIAPFHQHRLPRREAWEHISEHVAEILVTDSSTPALDRPPFPEGFAQLHSVFALHREFTPIRTVRRSETNCWSFQFDDQGNCVSRNASRV